MLKASLDYEALVPSLKQSAIYRSSFRKYEKIILLQRPNNVIKNTTLGRSTFTRAN